MTDYPDELWRSVADLSGLLLGEETQETTLKRVSDLAVRSIAYCDAVGVTLCTGTTPVTRAATGGLVYEVDNHQYDINEGPCLQSLLDRAVIDPAMGILIGQNGYSQELAFDELRAASQRQNRKLRQVAQEMVRAAAAGNLSAQPPG